MRGRAVVARWAHNPKVGGSNPSLATNFKLNNMSNMSYCRFENTARDLQECIDALDTLSVDGKDAYGDKLSSYELAGLTKLLDLSYNLVELREKIEVIFEEIGYNE